VGGPEKIEQASEKPIPLSPVSQKASDDLVMKDGRVRKALFSFVGTGILALVFTLYNLQKSDPQVLFIGVMIAITILSAVRFIQTKKKVTQEIMTKSVGEGQP
jgi:ABC-type multidrug transport system fused ATPase/permease subunit